MNARDDIQYSHSVINSKARGGDNIGEVDLSSTSGEVFQFGSTVEPAYENIDFEAQIKDLVEMRHITFDSIDVLQKQTEDLYLEICGRKSSSMSSASSTTSNDKYAKLGRANALQTRLLGQTEKAMRFCKNNAKQIRGEQEREAARVSLLTKLKLEAIQSEIKKGRSALNYGVVTIKNLMFSMVGRKASFLKLSKTYYLCVISCEDQVIGTKWAQSTNQNFVAFQELITLNEIEPNFEITLSVYSLTVPRCHKHLKSLLHRMVQPKLRLEGQRTLTAENFQKFGKFSMPMIPSSDLDGKFTMDFKGKLVVKEDLADHVNYGITIDDYVFWGRFWCALNCRGLQFYNEKSHLKMVLCFENIIGYMYSDESRNMVMWRSASSDDTVVNFLQFTTKEKTQDWKRKLNEVLILYKKYYP